MRKITTYYPQTQVYIGNALSDAQWFALRDLFEDHFNAYVVFTSSGRSAIRACLKAFGSSLHSHKIAVPKFLSRCVLDAVIDYAFPVHDYKDADIYLYYNQYGLAGTRYDDAHGREGGAVIDDRAHAFFHNHPISRPTIVSFPKFFDTGCGGALLLPNAGERDELLDFVKQTWRLCSSDEQFVQETFYTNVTDPAFAHVGGKAIDNAAVMLKHAWRMLPSTAACLPKTRQELHQVRRQRMERFESLRNVACGGVGPTFLDALTAPPFFFPCFLPDENSVQAMIEDLYNHGVYCSAYSINLHQPGAVPLYKRAVALPCHQNVSLDLIDAMKSIMRKHGASS